jgi:hypothetical protein
MIFPPKTKQDIEAKIAFEEAYYEEMQTHRHLYGHGGQRKRRALIAELKVRLKYATK